MYALGSKQNSLRKPDNDDYRHPQAPGREPAAGTTSQATAQSSAGGRGVATAVMSAPRARQSYQKKYQIRDRVEDHSNKAVIRKGTRNQQQADSYRPTQKHDVSQKTRTFRGVDESLVKMRDGHNDIPKEWYLDSYDDPDIVMKSIMSGDIESVPPRAESMCPSTQPHPGAYAMGDGLTQYGQEDAGTLETTECPTNTVTTEPNIPIAAEVTEASPDLDISSQIRRVLKDQAVSASSVAVAMNGSEERGGNSEREAQSRRWRMLVIGIMGLIFVAVVAVVATVAVLLTKDPPPTTTITVIIQLDDHPEETGWDLYRGDDKVAAVPPGSFSGESRNRVLTSAEVYVQEEHVFTIYDSGGNGMDDGYYKIYDSPDVFDRSTLLVEGFGNFTDREQHTFVAVGQTEN